MKHNIVALLCIILVISVCGNIYLWRQRGTTDMPSQESLQEQSMRTSDVARDFDTMKHTDHDKNSLRQESTPVHFADSDSYEDAIDTAHLTEDVFTSDIFSDEDEDVFTKEGAQKMLAGIAEMMQDPTMREVMRNQLKNLHLDPIYASLFHQLSLDTDTESALRDLIVDEMLLGMDMMDGLADPGMYAQLQEIHNAQRNALYEDMRTLLGDEDYETLTSYRDTLEERAFIAQLNQQIALRGEAPLSPMQQDTLTTFMREERETDIASGLSIALEDISPLTFHEIDIDGIIDAQIARNARVRERAQSILSDVQLQGLAQYQEAYIGQLRMGMEMSKRLYAPRTPREE